MTAIDGTYTLFVDPHGTLRLQMHGAPRSVFVGGLVETETTGTVVFVPAAGPPPRAGKTPSPTGDDDR